MKSKLQVGILFEVYVICGVHHRCNLKARVKLYSKSVALHDDLSIVCQKKHVTVP